MFAAAEMSSIAIAPSMKRVFLSLRQGNLEGMLAV